ncbi:hypothetical protein [Listeria seeligeri]|uniref:hypothetical protein n=1 Tax=Listeria seeligeri TaxID=1640 RepID=UPI0022EA8421|nr:hypothetical protein [Listeria seeligeri]
MELEKKECAFCEGEMVARIKEMATYKPMIAGYDSFTFIEYKTNRLTTVDDKGAISLFIHFCPMCGREIYPNAKC